MQFGGGGHGAEISEPLLCLTYSSAYFLAGFWIPYLSEIPHFDVSITTAVHVHAILLFSFLILLIVQPLAIRYGAFSIHRILGKLSNVLMPFIFVFSVAMLWKEYHEHLKDGMAAPMARNVVSLDCPADSLRHAVWLCPYLDTQARRFDTHAMHDLHRFGPLASWSLKDAGILVQFQAVRVSDRLLRTD